MFLNWQLYIHRFAISIWSPFKSVKFTGAIEKHIKYLKNSQIAYTDIHGMYYSVN